MTWQISANEWKMYFDWEQVKVNCCGTIFIPSIFLLNDTKHVAPSHKYKSQTQMIFNKLFLLFSPLSSNRGGNYLPSPPLCFSPSTCHGWMQRLWNVHYTNDGILHLKNYWCSTCWALTIEDFLIFLVFPLGSWYKNVSSFLHHHTGDSDKNQKVQKK